MVYFRQRLWWFSFKEKTIFPVSKKLFSSGFLAPDYEGNDVFLNEHVRKEYKQNLFVPLKLSSHESNLCLNIIHKFKQKDNIKKPKLMSKDRPKW